MEPKIYNIQGESFSLQANTLDVKKYGARLLARIQKLAFEYTKDTDFAVLEKYNERIYELETAKNQFQGLIDSNIDEHGNDLNYADKLDYIKRINEYEVKLEAIKKEIERSTEAQRIIKLKAELNKCAMIELLSDIVFIKEVFKKLLAGGDIEKIDFDNPDAMSFAAEVIYDFFCLMSGNGLK